MAGYKISSTFIENLFDDVHIHYCSYYDGFRERLKKILVEDLSEEDTVNIIDWALEYKNNLKNSISALEEFEERIKNKKLELSEERVRDNEIFEEIKKAIMPFAIVYWLNRTSEDVL